MLYEINNLSRIIGRKQYEYMRNFYSKRSYNVLFFGSDSIALSSLRKVNEFRKNSHKIKCLNIVTSNTSKNRTVIEKYAASERLQILTWPLTIQPGEYDIGLIVAFGHLIKHSVLQHFPMWRGAAPIIHTLLHGDQITGVTLMKIKPDVFDVGEIISQKIVPISQDIRLPELTEQLSEIGADMLVQCIESLPDSLTQTKPQSSEGVTYAKKINKTLSEVRWTEMDALQVYNLYRAIYGLYPLTTKFRDKQMKLFNAFIYDNYVADPSVPVGTLEFCQKSEAVKILCRDRKYIHFKSLRIVGKREISALDFYNGYIKNVSEDKRKCSVLQRTN
ncbi:methionyl-tRNA formyltransferase, mitochondrial isoform X2 [Achroia grisella]|uniref:methionyl-tRNA formyltransferase, mitochondrial isoform X2 n=1 Tax=Achroia grisella TaxID=688607 RepID=UPI0027D22ECA|nr:methionyl-tRNA formyltransferase, mitochondrial isoform X2 [Achroia grisella]